MSNSRQRRRPVAGHRPDYHPIVARYITHCDTGRGTPREDCIKPLLFGFDHHLIASGRFGPERDVLLALFEEFADDLPPWAAVRSRIQELGGDA